MKHNKILIIKASFMFLFIFNFIAIYGHNREDNMQKPSYIVNGQMYSLKSTENKNVIESGLSLYIEQKLPLMIYDGVSFRFFIKMKISRSGKIKKIKLLNKEILFNNKKVWNNIKSIMESVRFSPAMINNKRIKYVSKFYIQIDFTRKY
jgi:hypothetical protein